MNAPGPARVANSKLDNDLRKISLRWNRFAASGTGAVGTPQAVRRIELVAIRMTDGLWDNAVTLRGKLTMSGGSFIDSFKSGDPFQALYPLRPTGASTAQPYGTHASVGLLDGTGSNLGGMYLYGTLAYNPPAPSGTGHVGTLAPTFTATIPTASPPPSDTGLTPSWSQPSQTYGGGLPFTSTASLNSSYVTVTQDPVRSGNYVGQIKVAGDFTISGSNTCSIASCHYRGSQRYTMGDLGDRKIYDFGLRDRLVRMLLSKRPGTWVAILPSAVDPITIRVA